MNGRFYSLLSIIWILLQLSWGYNLPGVDPEIVGDIFDQGGISADLCKAPDSQKICDEHGFCKFGKCECEDPWSGKYCTTCKQCERTVDTQQCESLKACVEGEAFHQYWHHFGSAYECRNECKQYNFIRSFKKSAACTLDVKPVCGLDGETYDNKCQAENHNIPVACEGRCPCTYVTNICEFHGNLNGDNECKPYKFVVNGNDVHVYRPPCLVDDLDVNIGIWRGEQSEKDGSTYPHGWGALIYNSDDHLNREKFEGEMLWGVREGHGSLFWKDGSYYSGQWSGNVKEGEGTIFYSNGDIYAGQWSKEKKAGQGRYVYNQGMNGYYEGEFVDGKKCGNGYLEIKKHEPANDWEYFRGDYSQQGKWAQGAYNNSAGFSYSGEFDDEKGRYSGQGTYTWSCGKTYVGQFKDGRPDGEGTMTYQQGWTYVGTFKAGKFDGQGKFTWTGNNYYEGEFKAGEMTGVGIYGTESGGLFDSSVGLYYPNRNEKSLFFEAHFNGKVLNIKKQKPRKFDGGY